MKQLQITILFIYATITVASAQRIEFEYNEFGECVLVDKYNNTPHQ